jgi:(p)ppGpp synthase/HD superfamily hydrolase
VIGSDFQVVYNATRNDSPLHLLRRGGLRVAVCGEPLGPWGQFRVKDEFGVKDDPAASCLPCLVRHAARLAMIVHGKQIDQDGKPHIEHVKRVATSLEGDDEAVVVALLHDVVEDSQGVTFETLRIEHFPKVLVEAVWLLTRGQAESADTYLPNICRASSREGTLARRVKLADALDNFRRSKGDPVREPRYRGYVREVLDAMVLALEATAPFANQIWDELRGETAVA